MGTFNSTDNFTHWIPIEDYLIMFVMQITKIVISSFKTGVEMEKLEEVKMKTLFLHM